MVCYTLLSMLWLSWVFGACQDCVSTVLVHDAALGVQYGVALFDERGSNVRAWLWLSCFRSFRCRCLARRVT